MAVSKYTYFRAEFKFYKMVSDQALFQVLDENKKVIGVLSMDGHRIVDQSKKMGEFGVVRPSKTNHPERFILHRTDSQKTRYI